MHHPILCGVGEGTHYFVHTKQGLYVLSCLPCKLDFIFGSSLKQQGKPEINIPLPPKEASSESFCPGRKTDDWGEGSQGRLLSLFMESILKYLTVSRPACDDRHRGQEGTQDSL